MFGRPPIPARGNREIILHAETVGIEDAKTELRGGAALFDGELVPMQGRIEIAFTADPAGVDQPGIGLRVSDPLLSGSTAPAQRLARILRHLDAVREEQLPIALSGFLIALGGCPVPARETLCTLRAIAVEMQHTKLMLRRGVTLLRGALVMSCCIGEAGEDAVPAGVEESQTIRGFRIPSCCGD